MSEQLGLEVYREELAENARDVGHERALHAVTEDTGWSARARVAIERFVAAGDEFDADALRSVVGRGPSAGSLGAAIRAASQARLIEVAGFGRSRSVTRRGGMQLRWRGRRP